jgi:hypothetical protein
VIQPAFVRARPPENGLSWSGGSLSVNLVTVVLDIETVGDQIAV